MQALRTLPKYDWRSGSLNPVLYYFTNHLEANDLLARLPPGPLGFDLEWRPTYRKGQRENPVALVQLATADTVILLHIHRMTQFPAVLAHVLSSPSWVKAGVSIQYDCKKLYRDYGIFVCNCVDLALLARTVDNARWKGSYTLPLGLRRLLETYEQSTLIKGKTQRSNWEWPLNDLQLEYAANDAHAGYTIYSRLIGMASAMNPVPPPGYYSFSIVDGHLRDNLGVLPWKAHNPDYDPGPPPPPRNPEGAEIDTKAHKASQEHPGSAPDSETDLDHGT